MKQLIKHFEACVVVNLQHRRDRRTETEREFARIGVQPQFFTAIRPFDAGGFGSIGRRGCFESHLAVLMQARGLSNILICEDDINFCRVDPAPLLSALRAHDDWDVLMLGYLGPQQVEAYRLPPLTPWVGDILGTHCYAVNGPFIQRLSDYMLVCANRPPGHPLGGPMGMDAIINHMRYVTPDVRLRLAVPSLARQRSSRSDITPGFLDRIKWLQQPMLQLRHLRERALVRRSA